MKQGVRRSRPRRRFPRSFPSWIRWPRRLRLAFRRPSGAGGIGPDEPAHGQSSSAGRRSRLVGGARGVQRHGGRARPRQPCVHRVEVMASNVYGGLASGFHQVQAVNPTAGLRVNSGDGAPPNVPLLRRLMFGAALRQALGAKVRAFGGAPERSRSRLGNWPRRVAGADSRPRPPGHRHVAAVEGI